MGGALITFATYKAVMAGARVVKVDPSYTTQDCSVCGFRVPKTLAERLHECPECGAVMDRDYNASVNILRKGLTRLTGGRVGATRTYACGEGSGGAPSQEGVSHPSMKQESPCGSSGWAQSSTRSSFRKEGEVHSSLFRPSMYILSMIFLAMGAAALPPDSPCSTITPIINRGSLYGAKPTNQA